MLWNKDSRRKYEEIHLGALKAVEEWLKANDKKIAALQSERRQAILTDKEEIHPHTLHFISDKIDLHDKQISDLRETIRQVDDARILTKQPDFVECEVCGCLLRKVTAIRGDSEVRLRTEATLYGERDFEYIYRYYYCKIHAPKESNEP